MRDPRDVRAEQAMDASVAQFADASEPADALGVDVPGISTPCTGLVVLSRRGRNVEPIEAR